MLATPCHVHQYHLVTFLQYRHFSRSPDKSSVHNAAVERAMITHLTNQICYFLWGQMTNWLVD
jgi:hypothetical protein